MAKRCMQINFGCLNALITVLLSILSRRIKKKPNRNHKLLYEFDWVSRLDVLTWCRTANTKNFNYIAVKKMAQEEGFEPPTNRLTADCSTTELLLNKK